MKKSIKVVLSLIAMMLMSVSAFAQVTTSSLNGKITDANGAPVAGAAVIAVHTPSGTQYYAVADNDGSYYINGMRAGGPYTVQATCLGYKDVTFTDVTLQLAEPFVLNYNLPDDSEVLSEAIVISTASTKFSSEKTGAATNISSNQIMTLPSISRSVTDITKLSPYGGNGMNFSGTSGRSANFTVDGANFNNNFGLSTSLPGGGNPISIDAIEELQVVISPYDVRQSNFIGGGINAITKSGTNTFKGSAYTYHRNENMRGNRVNGKELAERTIDRTTTYGFTLGGPIIKNKLFFFVNGEYSVIPSTMNKWRPSEDGVADPDKNISRVTMKEAQDMRDFLISKYGYDPGSFTEYPADKKNYKMLARLDWNISDKHHLALRFNHTNSVTWSMPSSSRDIAAFANSSQSQYAITFANSAYSMNNKISTVSFDLNSRISNNLSNQFLVTYSDIEDVRGSNSDLFPMVEIAAGDLGETDMPYMLFGYELFTLYNRVGNQTLTVKDDLTYYKGAHKLTAGISYEGQVALNCYMRNGTGMFRYDSISAFKEGKAPVAMAFDWGYNGADDPSATVRFSQIGAYAQDEWKPVDNFKLTAGVRFDTIAFNNADVMTNNAILEADYGGRHIDTGMWPKTNIQISPRVGFSWDVLSDKTLTVRGGTGLFAGRLPLVFFTNMPTNSGMVKGRATRITDKALLEKFAGGLVTDRKEILNILNSHDPKKYPTTITPEDGTMPSEIAGVDPNFKMPQVWKSSIAIDYRPNVSFPLSFTAEYIFNKTINGVMLSNWNIKDENAGWATFNGADGRHIYPSSYKYTKTDAFVLTNTNKGYGSVLALSMNAEPVKNLRVTASATHTVAKELTGMPGSNASAAWQYIPSVEGPNFMTLHNSSYNNPFRGMVSLSYTTKNDVYSLFYEANQYGGNSYMYFNDINGDGYQYDLMYIPRDESEISFVSPADAARYWAFADQDEYLTAHKGEYAEAYAVTQPIVQTIDFHYAHNFRIKVGKSTNTLQLNFDINNLLNLFNSSWGVAKTFSPEAMSGRLLKYEYTNNEGKPVFSTRVPEGAKTWDYTYSSGNCWYMQIGLRYMFN
ncbi:MAG: TonB-dependent receptor [Bacteroidales bacterium]|nr:TonB-dependent receptor [Bacteroidales bacterium]